MAKEKAANIIIYGIATIGVVMNLIGLHQGTIGGMIWSIFPYFFLLLMSNRMISAKAAYLAVLLVLDTAFWVIAWTYQKSEILLMLSLFDTLKFFPAIVIAIIVLIIGWGSKADQ